MESKKKHKLEHWQILAALLMMYDFASILFSYFIALRVRFDCVYSSIPAHYLSAYTCSIAIYAIISVIVFWSTRLYRIVWRFASVSELAKVVGISISLSVLYAVVVTSIYERMPLSFYLWGGSSQLIFVVVIWFSYRFVLFLKSVFRKTDETVGRVMLIGAGSAGQMILRDINRAKEIKDIYWI